MSVIFLLLHLPCVPQYATRSFSDTNTNPAPERTWSLSSKEVKALSHASGSDYVYALTEDAVSINVNGLLALIHVFKSLTSKVRMVF